jgi:D-alanyl-D-alanine endopeptidase (penicillin-binding protein 7)
MPSSGKVAYKNGLRQVHRKSLFWIGPLALGWLCIAATPLSAQTAKAPTAAAKPAVRKAPAKKKPVYSAARARSRRANLVRARALATAREMAETVLPRYKVDASGELVPDVRAAAAIIYNPETNEVLWEENSQTPRSIASITKVMTATVFLESYPDLTETVKVQPSDVRAASTTFLRSGDVVTTDDLMHLLLIASDNAAARALARVSPHGAQGFIDRMNSKAAELGLASTRYADPSGLLSANVSSAYDMARLISMASANERISSIMRKPDYVVRTPKRTITFRSTDHLLGRDDMEVRAAKTGFISKSGYCLATLLRLPQSEQQFAVVVLGARSNAGRFLETRNLFSWLSNKASTLFATQTTATSTNQ